MKQIIHVSAGAAEHTWPTTLTETTGKDISADQVQISLGTADAPGTWSSPDLLDRPTTASVTAAKLVTNAVAPGTYFVWVKLTDDPEIVPRRGHRVEVR